METPLTGVSTDCEIREIRGRVFENFIKRPDEKFVYHKNECFCFHLQHFLINVYSIFYSDFPRRSHNIEQVYSSCIKFSVEFDDVIPYFRVHR